MSDVNMSVIQHLEALRKIIIKILIFFVLSLIASLFFVEKIYKLLALPLHGQYLTVLAPTETIRIYLMIAGSSAIGFTIPILLYQVWKFASPALTEKERKVTFLYLPVVFLMFVSGVLFAYFIVFPMLLRVLLQIAHANFNVMITGANYFDFMVQILLPFGLIFEMPVVFMLLTRLGVINPTRLNKMRKYAYFVLVILASILSPPELVSHLSVLAPMILLYEVSVQISGFVYRKQKRRASSLEVG